MSMNQQDIELEIETKGLTALRVKPSDIEDEIRSEHYFTAFEGVLGEEFSKEGSNAAYDLVQNPNVPSPLNLLTFCVLVLRNGFTVTGESACASPENFNEELGRKIARQHAVEKIWPLLGFRLRDRLSESPTEEELAEVVRAFSEK